RFLTRNPLSKRHGLPTPGCCPGRKRPMTEGEDVRVPQYPQQSAMPRLFSDAESLAGEGAGSGDDGVGVADDGGTRASGLPGGARPRADAGSDAFGSLLDGDLGVRGA